MISSGLDQNPIKRPDGQRNRLSQTRYTPYGAVLEQSGLAPTDRGDTGQKGTSFGLLDYNARFYDPLLGRFISPDSIVPDATDPISYDRYAYAGNNPINRTDPTGHCWGIASGIRGIPTYDTTCNNLDMAWVILTSDQTKTTDKVVAGAYITGEAIAHGTALVYGGALICGYMSPVCFKALTTGGGLLGALCHYGECADTAKAVGDKADEVLNSGSSSGVDNLQSLTGNGPGYEAWLQKTYGGSSISLDGTQFDNQVGNTLMEGKSGDWKAIDPSSSTYKSDAFSKFQNQIGRERAVAERNGFAYELHMINTPPQYELDWLTKSGINFIIDK